MPLILSAKERHLKTHLFVWKIIESEEYLFSLLSKSFQTYYRKEIEKVRSSKRRLELITSKIIIHNVEGIKFPVVHDEFGAPLIEGCDTHISISHSREIVFVAVSDNPIGIDVQYFTEKLLKINKAFLNKREISDFYMNSPVLLAYNQKTPEKTIKRVLQKLMLSWAAKEAVFKLYGIHNLDLKENVSVCVEKVFKYGYSTASINLVGYGKGDKNLYVDKASIRYIFFNDYIFVLAEYLHSINSEYQK